MRNTLIILATLACSAGITGCGPDVSPSELGHVIIGEPNVPGSEVAFPLPELGPPIPGLDRRAPPAPQTGAQPAAQEAEPAVPAEISSESAPGTSPQPAGGPPAAPDPAEDSPADPR